MTLTHRRIIYLIFIFLFLVFAPLILLYASGYRYNFKKSLLQKTGAITIDTNPEGAQIWLDNKLYKNKSPARLTNLLPQEYKVVVAKEGYYDWQRKVNVKASETIFLNAIEIFKDNVFPSFIEKLPEEIKLRYNTSTNVIEDNYEFNIVLQDKSFVITSKNLLNGTNTTLTTLPKSDYIFIEAPDSWLAVYDSINEILNLFKLSKGKIEYRQIISPVVGFDWSQKIDKIAYYNNFELWTMELNSGKKSLITRLGSGVSKALWHSSDRYLIYLTGNKIRIAELDESFERQNYDLIELPEVADIAINQKGNKLYLLAKIGSQEGWFEVKIQ